MTNSLKSLLFLFTVITISVLFGSCKKNACKDVTCQHKGVAEVKEKECNCKCAEGYVGNFCEQITQAKIASFRLRQYIGTWNAEINKSCSGYPEACQGYGSTYNLDVKIDTIGLDVIIYDRQLSFDTIIDNTIKYGHSGGYNGTNIFEINENTGEFIYYNSSGGLAATFSTSIKGKIIPFCVRSKISVFKSSSTCNDVNVKEYTFQNKTVYVFDNGTCGADMASEVIDSNCVSLGYLGGISGNTKINGEDFSNAKFVKTIWQK